MTTIREMAKEVLVDDKDPRIVGPTENEVALARAVITLSARVEFLELLLRHGARLGKLDGKPRWFTNTGSVWMGDDGLPMQTEKLLDLLRMLPIDAALTSGERASDADGKG